MVNGLKSKKNKASFTVRATAIVITQTNLNLLECEENPLAKEKNYTLSP